MTKLEKLNKCHKFSGTDGTQFLEICLSCRDSAEKEDSEIWLDCKSEERFKYLKRNVDAIPVKWNFKCKFWCKDPELS